MARSVARARMTSMGAALCAVALVGLGACSSSGSDAAANSSAPAATATTSPTPTAPAPTLTVSQIVEQTKAKVQAAKTGRVKGSGTDDGTPIQIVSAGTMDGSTAIGTITRGDAKAEYVAVDGKAYVRGNQAYWTASGASAALAKTLGTSNKWVQVPAAKAKSLIEAATIGGVIKQLVKTSDDITDSNTKLSSAMVGDKDVWVLSDPGSSGTSLTIDKATSLPIRMEGGSEGSFDFDQWDAVQAPTAPAAADVYTP